MTIAVSYQPRPLAPFRPLPWQVAPFHDRSPILVLTGSAGGGKSRIAAEKMHAYMLRYPNAFGLVVRKNRSVMTNSVILFLQRSIIGNEPRVRFVPSKFRFEYSNGSILAWGGMNDEKQREAIRSIGGDGGTDIIWIEEANALVEDDFNELLARNRHTAAPWQQIILSTNPDRPTHWIYKRLMLGAQAAVYYSHAPQNPHNSPGYLKNLSLMTGVLKERLVEGKWIHAEGAVYKEFSEEIHVLDRFDIPTTWSWYAAVDWGYTGPFVHQWWAVDHDGRMYLVWEIFKTQTLIKEHIETIQEVTGGLYIHNTVVDPSNPEGIRQLEAAGIETINARNAIAPGIQAVKARLAIAGDGKPRIYYLKDAVVEVDQILVDKRRPLSTIEEKTAYSWKKQREGYAEKEEPIDNFNDGMDTERYMVMYLDDDDSHSTIGTHSFTDYRGGG